ncbi:MAG TPA: hypothetical protein VF290_02530 [Pyrinomonadaceae bacterium]
MVDEDKDLSDAVVDLETGQIVNGAVETYPMPKHGWTCFHCGETFTTIGSAQDHFGATPESRAGCLIDHVALETGTGTERGRGLLMELRKVEASRDEWMDQALRGRNEIEALECRVESLTSAMQSYEPFRECNSIRDVFFVFDSMEGRAIAAEDRLNQLAGVSTNG